MEHSPAEQGRRIPPPHHPGLPTAPAVPVPEPPLSGPLQAAIAEAERLIATADFINDERDLAEGYEYLAGSIAAVTQLSGVHGTSHPQFVSSTGPYTKMGLDNPDTLYYHANIEPGAEYLVTGTRGTTVDLSFQVLTGDYTATDVPNGDDAFDDRRVEIDADGGYRLRFGPPRDNPGPNYFVLGERASMLAVREVYGDWAHERKGTIRIERVDTVGTAPAAADLDRQRKRYRAAARMLVQRIHTWFNFPKWFYLDLPVNTLTEPRLTPGGLSTQFSSVGHFDLAEDEALLITVPESDAPYQGFQLGSRWYISLDYVNHQTSLNSTQAQVDPDGMIRMVVSARNPGIANWIETTARGWHDGGACGAGGAGEQRGWHDGGACGAGGAGEQRGWHDGGACGAGGVGEHRRRGIVQFRWQRTARPMTAADGPSVQVLAVDEVAKHLPHYETNRIDEEGWRARIAERQRAFAERML